MTLNFAALLARVYNFSIHKRAAIAFIAGALATSSMPPWNAWPVLWVAFPAFLILLEASKSNREAFYTGWSFGFGYFAIGFAWIGNAFFVDSETFAALAVPSIGGLAAGFALYAAIVGLLLRVLTPPIANDWPGANFIPTICRISIFSSVWALVEWWRGWFMTGLPWNPIGSTWTTVPATLQGASLFGVYGLSFLTVFAASALVLVTVQSSRRMAPVAVILFHTPLIAMTVWGAVRLPSSDIEFVPDIMLRLVQPNIAQVDKWRPGLREQHVLEQVRLSTTNADNVTHVLWAETAVPFPLNQAAGALAATAQAAPKNGYVLTGAPRVIGQRSDRQAFNSFFAVTPDGKIKAVYDKTHLVPFGEYMPLREYIPIPQITGGTGFTPGIGAVMITLPGLPSFSPLICYEVIFPGAVTSNGDRPSWLFNLTNDAWFGDSSGPHQHLAAAQMRSVEEGLPVVRVANTGISAVMDGYGRILDTIPLGKKGFLDHRLPKALNPTLFSSFEHGPFLGFVIFLMAITIWISRRHSKKYMNQA